MSGPNRESVDARYVPPEEWDWRYQKNMPGDWTVYEEDGERDLICCLPGGHHGTCPLRPQAGASRPAWDFNESLEAPTLSPSVHCMGTTGGGETITLWHGWLREGRWVSC